jgi:Fe-S-cluster formation regulator IscX/YfhJ
VVNLSVVGNVLRVEVLGWRKWLTFIPRFDIATDCIARASVGPAGLPQFRRTDRRVGAASIPGWFALGRFSMGQPRQRAFLDLRRSSKEVVILDLKNFRYDLVMVEVDDARKTVERILEAIGAISVRSVA